MLTVRLALLTDPALNAILSKSSSICKSYECKSIISSFFLNREHSIINQSSDSFKSRYCNQSFTESKWKESLKQIDCDGFQCLRFGPSLAEDQNIYKAVVLKDDIYIFVANHDNMTLRQYSNITKVWENLVDKNRQ